MNFPVLTGASPRTHLARLCASHISRTLHCSGTRQVSFRFKAEEASSSSKFDTETHFGFIAQEVRKVLPDIVHEDIDGWLGLEYQSLIALLVEALKRQQIEIRELRNEQARQEVEIKQLKVTVNSLPRRLSALEEATVAR